MTKLFEHILNGNGSITLGLGNGIINEPLLLLEDDEEAPQEYRDITSIINLDAWGHEAKYSDFLRVRSAILDEFYNKAIAACLGTVSNETEAVLMIPNINSNNLYYFLISETPSGLFSEKSNYIASYSPSTQVWSFLSKEDLGFILSDNFEKDVAVKYSIMSTKVALEEGYSIEKIVSDNLEYHKKAQDCRTNRLLEASVYVWNIIPEKSSQVVGTIISPIYGNLYFLYKEFGIKGTLEDYDSVRNKEPGPGILDYIMSRSVWQDNGIYGSSWQTTNGVTTVELSLLLYNLLHKGISPR